MRFHKVLAIVLALASSAFAATQTNGQTPTSGTKTSTATKHKTTLHHKPTARRVVHHVVNKPVVAGNPHAILTTSMGKLHCELFPEQAPKTVANFIGLAEGTKEWTNPQTGKKSKTPLYNRTIFHRVIPNFMIQGGDPIGNGTGDPGYRFDDEVSPELQFDRPGRMAMANSGPNTNGSQFFITEVPYPGLNNHYSIFGQCDDASVAVVKKIARVPSDPRNNRPDVDVKLDRVQIVSSTTAKKKPTTYRKKPLKKTMLKKKSAVVAKKP